MKSVENVECGNCGMWKIRSVENAEDLMISTTITSTPFLLKSDASLRFHDVVWWLTKFIRKNCRCNHNIFSHFSARPRGNKNAATIPSATLLLLPMVLVE